MPKYLVLGYSNDIKEAKERYKRFVFKNIFTFTKIRKHDSFVKLFKQLACHIGQTCAYDSLGKACNLSSDAVAKYVFYLEQCSIVRVLPSFARNGSNELKKSKKIYFCDLGIRNAAINDFSPFSSRSDTERGALWENFFIMERMKYHDYTDDGINLYFWRDKQKHEVDLIEVGSNTMHAYECKTNKEDVFPPSYFTSQYPTCSFSVATMKNFYRYFS